MMTASQLEPCLHLTPPVLTRPDFGKTSDEDYMTVARANGQVKKIFIFFVLSHNPVHMLVLGAKRVPKERMEEHGYAKKYA